MWRTSRPCIKFHPGPPQGGRPSELGRFMKGSDMFLVPAETIEALSQHEADPARTHRRHERLVAGSKCCRARQRIIREGLGDGPALAVCPRAADPGSDPRSRHLAGSRTRSGHRSRREERGGGDGLGSSLAAVLERGTTSQRSISVCRVCQRKNLLAPLASFPAREDRGLG